MSIFNRTKKPQSESKISYLVGNSKGQVLGMIHTITYPDARPNTFQYIPNNVRNATNNLCSISLSGLKQSIEEIHPIVCYQSV